MFTSPEDVDALDRLMQDNARALKAKQAKLAAKQTAAAAPPDPPQEVDVSPLLPGGYGVTGDDKDKPMLDDAMLRDENEGQDG